MQYVMHYVVHYVVHYAMHYVMHYVMHHVMHHVIRRGASHLQDLLSETCCYLVITPPGPAERDAPASGAATGDGGQPEAGGEALRRGAGLGLRREHVPRQ